jgi:TonB family protein
LSKALIISLSVHILLFFMLWRVGWKRVSDIYVPQVYQVQLIAMPEAAPPPPEEQTPVVEVETIPPPPEEETKLKPKLKEAKTRPDSARTAVAPPASSEGVSSVRTEEVFEFGYYLSLMTGKIRRNWRNPYSGKGEKIRATIYFQVLRDGTIINYRVDKSSGASTFDRAALRAVIVSTPLPQLPPDYQERQLTVYLDFEYEYSR